MPLRFLDEQGSGDLDSGIKAIDYAISKHVAVISASWGASVSQSEAQPLIDAVKRADDAGITFVVAAANDGANNDQTEVYPANATFANTITVAASDKNDGKPSWSNYGKRRVSLASPGDTIMSTLPGNKYGNLSGTSMATPLVAGLVAFLKAQDASLSGAQVRSLLQLTGAKTSIETACNCRVDALASVDALLNKKLFVTPAATTVEVGGTLQFSGTYGRAPYQFAVADSGIGSISETGLLTTMKTGTTTVTVRDAAGATSTSLDIRVVDKGNANPAPNPPGQPGQPPSQPGSCPLGDQSLCDALCGIEPTLPFCKP